MVNDTVYAIGSVYGPGGIADCLEVEAAPIQPDGSLGAWAATTALQTPRCYASTGASLTHLYAVGGYSGGGGNSSSYLVSVEYTSPLSSVIVPTLAQWGMIILLMLFGLATVCHLRRHRIAR
jgi:hypothetical protein